MSRLKLALIAYACDRDDVSETWCSYQWTSRLVRRHDATVFVYSKRSRFGAARRQLPEARVFEWRELPFLDRLPALQHMLKPGYLDYYGKVRGRLRRLLAAGERFDLVHQYEPFAPRYPAAGGGLGPPFVLGPLGGAVDTPPGFEAETSGQMAWFTRLRSFDRVRFRHDPWLRRSYAAADLVLGIAPYMRELLAPCAVRAFDLLHETGVEVLPADRATRGERAGFRLLYVGRVVRTKGVRDGIRALARIPELPVSLDVVGDGDDRTACQAEAARLGVDARVRFHGWLGRADVERFYAEADAFLFPSFREASGQVVIEAMSFGLPVIAADHGGPGYTVGDGCGLTVVPRDPAQYAAALAEAVRGLAADPQRAAAMGRAARAKVARQFLWDRKVERLEEIYAQVLERAARERAA